MNPLHSLIAAGDNPGIVRHLLDTLATFDRTVDGRSVDPVRGYGFLDLRGTSAKDPARLGNYVNNAYPTPRPAFPVGLPLTANRFPYWVLAANPCRDDIRRRRVVTARPGALNAAPHQLSIIPVGPVPFVVTLAGQLRMGPPLRQGPGMTVNHGHISHMAVQVAFAGMLYFGGVYDEVSNTNGTRGVLHGWSNDSGGYRCSDHDARRVGLPMEMYRGEVTAPRSYIDGYRGGRGQRINWGRHGAPPSAAARTYWVQ